MRDIKKIVENHPRVPANLSPGDKEIFVATEVALEFLATYFPNEKITSFPGLMMGYPDLVAATDSTGASHKALSLAYSTVRHVCARVSSRLGWEQAVRRYCEAPETERCHAPDATGVRRRSMAPIDSLEYLQGVLRNKAPHRETRLKAADFTEAFVRIDHGQATVKMRIPQAIVPSDASWEKHRIAPRETTPPIEIDRATMRAIAEGVDEAESQPAWPRQSLPPLNLASRLAGIRYRDVAGVFPAPGKIRLEGANHVIGMLSSGKSSLVLGILFYVAKQYPARKCAVIAGNTQEAAALAARLKRHGIKTAQFASFQHRGEHLGAALRSARLVGLAGGGLQALGSVPSMFETGCPLNGAQGSQPPEPVRGDRERQAPEFPRFKDRPCNSLRPSPDQRPADCPLWPVCPAHAQERQAADAQIWIFTPAAFIHMIPSKWTIGEELTFPELVQHACDLVIVDEVDSVQGTFDEHFAPQVNIMADSQEAFGPEAMEKPGGAIRSRSAGQVRNPQEREWIFKNLAFQTVLWRIYDVMENHKQQVRRCYWNRFFTAESILVELARARMEGESREGGNNDDAGASTGAIGDEFMDVLRCASFIRDAVFERRSRSDAPTRQIYEKAGATLQEVARLAQAPSEATPDLIERLRGDLAGSLRAFNPLKVRSRAVADEDKAVALLLAALTGVALSLYAWLARSLPGVEGAFGLSAATSATRSRQLIDRYRGLIPQNPAGAALGLLYEDPRAGDEPEGKGGSLTLIHHAGVGRYLLAQLHNLLGAEGQSGPHTLLLSGTSWAGGGPIRDDDNEVVSDGASPIYDVQVPVRGVLQQSKEEVDAVRLSVFDLVKITHPNGKPLRVSGTPPDARPIVLKNIATHLASQTPDGRTPFDIVWQELEDRWVSEDLSERKRVLVVTNSYDDAYTFARALGERLRGPGFHGPSWTVRHLVRDQHDGRTDQEITPWSAPLERSRVERFGEVPCPAVLVAPIQVIWRGHNILNRNGNAAISAIYFVHRPHHRPDDYMQVISRVNRAGQDAIENGVPGVPIGTSPAPKVRALQKRGRSIQREALGRARYGYSQMNAGQQEQFAWSTITTIWQAIGRGIRNGVPVYAGFIDSAFAPESFQGRRDDGSTSVLVKCIEVLERRMAENGDGENLARALYFPFYEALRETRNLVWQKEVT